MADLGQQGKKHPSYYESGLLELGRLAFIGLESRIDVAVRLRLMAVMVQSALLHRVHSNVSAAAKSVLTLALKANLAVLTGMFRRKRAITVQSKIVSTGLH